MERNLEKLEKAARFRYLIQRVVYSARQIFRRITNSKPLNDETSMLSKTEMSLLLYAAIWPRSIGLPIDGLAYNDQAIADDLVQKGYINLVNNKFSMPALYWSDKTYTLAILALGCVIRKEGQVFEQNIDEDTNRKEEEYFLFHIIKNLPKIYSQIFYSTRKNSLRDLQIPAIYFDWRPVSAVPIRPESFLYRDLPVSHIREHTSKYSYKTSDITKKILQNSQEKFCDLNIQYNMRFDGIFLFEIACNNENDSKSLYDEIDQTFENLKAILRSNELSLEKQKEMQVINQICKSSIDFDIDESADLFSFQEKYAKDIEKHWQEVLRISAESEIVRVISKTIKEDDRHSRGTSEMYVLYSDRAEAKRRRYSRRIDSVEEVHLRGALSVRRAIRWFWITCVIGWNWRFPPLSVLNRVQLVDANYVLRHDPIKIKKAGNYEEVCTRAEHRERINDLSGYYAEDVRNFKIWREDRGEVDLSQPNRVIPNEVVFYFRRLFFRKFEIAKRRIDLFVKTRERKTIIVVYIFTVMLLVALLIVGLSGSFVGSYFGASFGRVMFIVAGVYFAYRIYSWLLSVEMLPSIDLLRSSIVYCKYAQTYSRCAVNEFRWNYDRYNRTMLARGKSVQFDLEDGSDVEIRHEVGDFDKDTRHKWDFEAVVQHISDLSAPIATFVQRLDAAKRKVDRYRYNLTALVSLSLILIGLTRISGPPDEIVQVGKADYMHDLYQVCDVEPDAQVVRDRLLKLEGFVEEVQLPEAWSACFLFESER